MFVNAENRRFYSEVPEEDSAPAGVFRGDQPDELEDLQRSKRDVFEIADGRRHDVKHPLRVSGHQRILSYHCEDGLSLDQLTLGRHARG